MATVRNFIKVSHLTIGRDSPTFIVAEAGSNHDGKLDQAFRLINVAADAGADAIKFQIFKAAKLYPPNCGAIMLNGKEFDLYDFFVKSEVDYGWIPKLKKYCEDKKIIFFATPFDEESADILEKNDVPCFKVASPELNHIPLIRHIAKKRRPMFISDGLGTLSDIASAIEAVRQENNEDLVITHCVSAYPAPEEDYNLNFLKTLRNVLGVLPGVSDHTLHPTRIPTIAVAVGAVVVEKHFTIDRKLNGADHSFALEPKEFSLMVRKIRDVERYSEKKKQALLRRHPRILGGYEKVIASSEKDLYPGDKRSLFSATLVRKGEKFSRDNIRILRAERFLQPGIHPRYFDLILGKTCRKSITAWTGVQWENILI